MRPTDRKFIAIIGPAGVADDRNQLARLSEDTRISRRCQVTPET
jgi:hypothetical protein